MRGRKLESTGMVCAALIGLSGCGAMEDVALTFRSLTPHEAYFESLVAAGLADAALGEAWLEASAIALSGAPTVALPYQEEGYLFSEIPEARSYRVRLRRGQSLSVDVSFVEEAATRLFVDIYRLRENRDPVPVASTDSIPAAMTYTASRETDYVVRVQPELLRGGQYAVTLRADASMSFPVQDRNTQAILSRFGVDRDGGRRSHRGVDIFAPRDTPVLSATNGRVSRVEVTNLGGKVVWVRDSDQPQSIYYAHLDSQVVQTGAQVRKGDLLGLVGNTGNARTTPPHLHFSVYRRGEGAVDPFFFLYRTTRGLAELTASTAALGEWSRTSDPDIRFRAGPSRDARVLAQLPEHTALRIVAATGSWYRVTLPDGETGYVAARLTEPLDDPVRTEVLAATTSIQARPVPGGGWVHDLELGTDVDILGRFEDYLLVRSGVERPGWMSQSRAQADR